MFVGCRGFLVVSFVWSHSRVFTKDSDNSGVVKTGIPNSRDFLRI